LESISSTKDALAVRRAFGEPYEFDGVMVIPVARVGGGAGGGGGEGTDEKSDAAGSGFGTGFGLGISPMGVYEVRGTETVWKPAVDVNRVLKGGQVLAGIVVVCTTLVLLRRRRS
jgi:uncharacterized spore protein YtfJ